MENIVRREKFRLTQESGPHGPLLFRLDYAEFFEPIGRRRGLAPGMGKVIIQKF